MIEIVGLVLPPCVSRGRRGEGRPDYGTPASYDFSALPGAGSATRFQTFGGYRLPVEPNREARCVAGEWGPWAERDATPPAYNMNASAPWSEYGVLRVLADGPSTWAELSRGRAYVELRGLPTPAELADLRRELADLRRTVPSGSDGILKALDTLGWRFKRAPGTAGRYEALPRREPAVITAEAVYVDGRSHYVRWSTGRVEYRHDGRNGWVHRDAQPSEYENLTGWHPAVTGPHGSVATPAVLRDKWSEPPVCSDGCVVCGCTDRETFSTGASTVNIINLTPHVVRLQDSDGRVHEYLPVEKEKQCRVRSRPGALVNVVGVPVPIAEPQEWGEVENLPPYSPNNLYIVSLIVLQRLNLLAAVGEDQFAGGPYRPDVVAPGTGPNDGAVRGMDGMVFAVTRLVRG